ncbi:transglutaminase TgpA family protein [Priestia megaterium]|uniref:transglutaminase TgpA family protein n=1 Tax=Priestia megaterium TaxID=1404 RepID=UPI00298D1AEE|nr:transglutaminaseTgpA domain-containing protein [Priestia megaterium]
MNKSALYVKNILLYAGAFFLLVEWLLPLNEVTDTNQIQYFILFVVYCFLCLTFRLPFIVMTLGSILFILFSLHNLYFQGAFFSSDWLPRLFEILQSDAQSIMEWNIANLSFEMRSTLFFVLLWIMAYLIRYWIFYQKRIFFFFFLTILYITVLDTFSTYDAGAAIIRVTIIGFLLVAMLRINPERIKAASTERLENRKRSFLFLGSFLAIVIVLAYLAPKPGPQWPDPVPFITAHTTNQGQGESASGQRIGYDMDDSKLGGSFVNDDTIVFIAKVEDEHYWRIETKDVYTGKGWELSKEEEKVPFKGNENLLPQYDSSVAGQVRKAEVTYSQPSVHLMHVPQLLSLTLKNGIQTDVTPTNEKLYPYQNDKLVTVQSYELTYKYPVFDIGLLQQAEEKKAESLENKNEFIARYTQLPANLPKRVKDLAREVTKNKNNRYEKAKAVEEYFRSNPYVYDTENVPIPTKNKDYVDQFLFDTKRGYCDNFSTSMVVLLRSLDIPARWVKGYTEGDATVISGSSKWTTYEITQNNAHSWVEVYFPGAGWIPFEPTKSFSNPYDFVDSQPNSSSENSQREEEKQETQVKEQPKEKELPAQEERAKEKTASLQNAKLSMKWKVLFCGLIVIMLIVIYLNRFKWFLPFYISFYKKKESVETFELAYAFLLKRLAANGLKRQGSQTLRDFAGEVDEKLNTVNMLQLTEKYERVLYRNTDSIKEWKESIELWENLIKKTSS